MLAVASEVDLMAAAFGDPNAQPVTVQEVEVPAEVAEAARVYEEQVQQWEEAGGYYAEDGTWVAAGAAAGAVEYDVTDEDIARNLAHYSEQAVADGGYWGEDGEWHAGWYDDIYRWHEGYYDEAGGWVETGVVGYGHEKGAVAAEEEAAGIVDWMGQEHTLCDECKAVGEELLGLQAAAAGHKECLIAALWVSCPPPPHTHPAVSLRDPQPKLAPHLKLTSLCDHRLYPPAHPHPMRPTLRCSPFTTVWARRMEPSARLCTWRQRTVRRSVRTHS